MIPGRRRPRCATRTKEGDEEQQHATEEEDIIIDDDDEEYPIPKKRRGKRTLINNQSIKSINQTVTTHKATRVAPARTNG